MPISPIITPNLKRSIVILTFDDAQLLDITGPLQVFATANEMMALQEPVYEIQIVAKKRSIRTTSGVVLQCTLLADAPKICDTLLVSGGKGINHLCQDGVQLDWIRSVFQKARRIASVCSGAFALAEAGLLDGKKATTHWNRCEEFQRHYPKVRLDHNAIYIRQEKIWTSAGITSGIDMALAMVEEDCGFEVAKSVARQLVVFLRRPGGQAQFSTLLDMSSDDERFNRLNLWVMQNLQKKLDVKTLAEKTNMSSRNFTRLYTKSVGYSPAKAVEMMRVERARTLLEKQHTMKQIMRQCGFGSEETMRQSFLKLVGVSPKAYRQRFAHHTL